MELRFDYKGSNYGLDLEDEFTVDEARLIKQHARMTVKQFVEGFQEGDVDSIVGIVVLGVRRGGGQIEWSDLDGMNLMDLLGSMRAPDGTPLSELSAAGQTPELPEALNRAARRSAAKPEPAATTNGSRAATKAPARKRAAAR